MALARSTASPKSTGFYGWAVGARGGQAIDADNVAVIVDSVCLSCKSARYVDGSVGPAFQHESVVDAGGIGIEAYSGCRLPFAIPSP